MTINNKKEISMTNDVKLIEKAETVWVVTNPGDYDYIETYESKAAMIKGFLDNWKDDDLLDLLTCNGEMYQYREVPVQALVKKSNE